MDLSLEENEKEEETEIENETDEPEIIEENEIKNIPADDKKVKEKKSTDKRQTKEIFSSGAPFSSKYEETVYNPEKVFKQQDSFAPNGLDAQSMNEYRSIFERLEKKDAFPNITGFGDSYKKQDVGFGMAETVDAMQQINSMPNTYVNTYNFENQNSVVQTGDDYKQFTADSFGSSKLEKPDVVNEDKKEEQKTAQTAYDESSKKYVDEQSGKNIFTEGADKQSLREAEAIEEWHMKYRNESSLAQTLERYGYQAIQSKTAQDENDTVYVGAQAIGAFVGTGGNLSDILGAQSAISIEKDIQNNIGYASVKFSSLINENKVSTDLLYQSPDKIKSVLSNFNISGSEINNIIKYQSDVLGRIEMQNSLISKIESGEMQLSDEAKKMLYSSDFLRGKSGDKAFDEIINQTLLNSEYSFLKEKPLDAMSHADLENALKNIQETVLQKELLTAYDNGKIQLTQEEIDSIKLSFSSNSNVNKSVLIKFMQNRGATEEEIKQLKTLSVKELKEKIREKCNIHDNVTEQALKELLSRQKLCKLKRGLGNAKGIKNRLTNIFRTLTDDGIQKNDDIAQRKKIFAWMKRTSKASGLATRLSIKMVKGTLTTAMFTTTIPGRIVAMKQGRAWGLKKQTVTVKKISNGRVITKNKTKIVRDPYNSIYKKTGDKYKKIQKARKDAAKESVKRFTNSQKKRAKEKVKNQLQKNRFGRAVLEKNAKKTAKKAAKKGQKTITKKILSTVTAPFKAVGKLLGKVGAIKRKIIIAVIAFILGTVIIYFLGWGAYYLVSYVLDAFLITNDEVILAEPDDLGEMVDSVQKFDQERFVKALDTALNPIVENGLGSDAVYGGYTVKYYGLHTTAEETVSKTIGSLVGNTKDYTFKEDKYNYEGSNVTNGYHIYYIDSDGNQIGQETSNIKDVIAMAASMTTNSAFSAEDNTAIMKRIVNELYPLMNPDINIVESPIYYDETGCHWYPETNGTSGNGTSPLTYYCTDASIYTEAARLSSEGVHFFDELDPQTESGCRYKVICDGHEHPGNAGEDGIEGTDDDNEGYTEYHDTIEGLVSDGISSGCDHSHVEYFCNGDHEAVKTCPGHKDVNVYVTILSCEDLFNYPDGNIVYKVPNEYTENGTIAGYKELTTRVVLSGDYGPDYQTFLDDGAWACNGYKEQVKQMVDADWYELYGLDINNKIAHIQGHVLSAEDMEIMTNLVQSSTGSAQAQEMTNYALQYVGRISYLFGSKPTGIGDSGIPSNGTLDCSGFVSWCYGHVTGSLPRGLGTANFTNSVGAVRISYNDLRAGDVGLIGMPGSSKNHIGIYVGKDENGTDWWVHCNSSDKGVSCNNVGYFRYYFRVFQ